MFITRQYRAREEYNSDGVLQSACSNCGLKERKSTNEFCPAVQAVFQYCDFGSAKALRMLFNTSDAMPEKSVGVGEFAKYDRNARCINVEATC